MPDFVMTIAGEAGPTEDTFGVRNPATGEVFAQAPECTRQQLDAAFDAAAKAARDWKARDDDSAYVELARRPLGVLAAITPWNFPLTLVFWKIAPALRAGNSRHRSSRRPRHHDPETSPLTQRGFDGERVPPERPCEAVVWLGAGAVVGKGAHSDRWWMVLGSATLVLWWTHFVRVNARLARSSRPPWPPSRSAGSMRSATWRRKLPVSGLVPLMSLCRLGVSRSGSRSENRWLGGPARRRLWSSPIGSAVSTAP